MRRLSTLAIGVSCFGAVAPAANAQILQPLLEVGDSFPGGFTIDAIERARTDSMLRFAAKSFDGTDELLVTETGIVLAEGRATPGLAGGTVTGLRVPLVDGEGLWASRVWFAHPNGNSYGLWANSQPLLLKGSVSNAPQVSPGTTYESILETWAFDGDWIALTATLRDPALPPPNTYDAVVLLEVDASGALVSEQVPYREDGVLPGLAGPIISIGYSLDTNASGAAIYTAAVFTGPSSTPVVFVDDVEVLGPNVPFPIANTFMVAPLSVGLNDAGDHAYLAEFVYNGNHEQALVRNGSVLVSTSNTFAGIAPGNLHDISEDDVLRLADDGSLLWRGTWYVGDPPPLHEGLFVDDELIVWPGVTQIEGKTILTVAGNSHAISPDGRFVTFVGTLSDGTSGLLAVERRALMTDSYCFGDGSGAPCPCGNEILHASGCRNSNSTWWGPRLSSTGSVSVSADDLAFQGTGLVPNQSALLFVGHASIAGGDGVGFGDGLRCAGTSVVRLGIVAPDSSGNAAWGPGLAPTGGWSAGDERSFQVWYRDPAGPCGSGFNLTNARRATFFP